jgi:hypothetical protein
MCCGGGHLVFRIGIKKQKLCLYQVSGFFLADWKSKMAATAGHRLTFDPMGKCSNAFFSETTNMIKAKLYMNVHWMALKTFKHFPIGSNVNLCAAVVAILYFGSA